MELLFVDESGDNGFAPGSTPRFILGGVSISADRWKELFWNVITTKEQISRRYGIRLTEFKAADLFTHRGAFFNTRMGQEDTIWIYERLIDLLCEPCVTLFVTVHSKAEFRNQPFPVSEKHLTRAFTAHVWRQYLGEYEAFLLTKADATGQPENGIVYYDSNPGHEKYVRRVVRDLARKFDQEARFPHAGIVEDVVLRDSKTSYFIQLADVLAYSVYQLSLHTSAGTRIVTDSTAERLRRKIGPR